MELYKEIFEKVLKERQTDLFESILKLDFTEIIENECYKALKKIKEILDDNSLDDNECFMKIEKIVCIFEEFGSNCGNRHDFG